MKISTILATAGSAALAAACASGPAPTHTGRAAIPIMVTADPVQASSGPVKSGSVVGRHKVVAAGGAVLTADVVGVIRPVPAGTPLAEGTAGAPNGIVKIFCDVRQIGRWSFDSTDCFEDSDGDGRFDTIWQGDPSISYFMLSLSTAGLIGVIPPAPYREATEAERPASEIGFRTFVCWNGLPAFLLSVPVYETEWSSGTGPCGAGNHPGEVSKDGMFRGIGASIKVTGGGDAATYEVVERIPPGPISLAMTSARY